MVHEIVEIAKNSFNLNLDFLDHQKQLQRTCSGFVFGSQSHQDSLSASANTRLRLNSTENLSWTFFEEVSTLDNQLSKDESHNDSRLMSGSSHSVGVVPTTNGHHDETITRLSNGFAIAENLSADIFPQQSPDLILQQPQPLPTYDLPPPTATQTWKLELANNFNFNNNNKNPYEPSVTSAEIKVQLLAVRSQPQSPTSPNIYLPGNCTAPTRTNAANTEDNDYSTATKQCQPNDSTLMISSGSAINASKATGTVASRSITIRTLPAVSTCQSHAERVDLVVDTRATAGCNKRSRRLAQQTMGATLPGGSKVNASRTFVDNIETHLSLIGWRKKCLYAILALLLLLIITNLVLTLWILKVMEFSMEGMGQLRIVPGGIQLTGQALIMDMLRASTIRSRHGQPIAIESSRNFSINTRDTNGILENHLFLGHDKLECLSTGFRINDTTGRNLFSVNRNEVTIGAHALRIDGEGGAIFRESIQTPHVRAEPGRELRLESPTRQLELTAAKDLTLQSRAGGIELSALEDIKLSALDGSLRLESSKIFMPNLRTAQPPIPGTAQSRDHMHRVFQLCACSNGKLFLAAPHSICAGDDSTVCR